jgi:hypothetical protein
MRKLPPRASRRVGGEGNETKGVKNWERADRERVDGRADGHEGRKEVACMRSTAGKRGEQREDRKWVQVERRKHGEVERRIIGTGREKEEEILGEAVLEEEAILEEEEEEEDDDEEEQE